MALLKDLRELFSGRGRKKATPAAPALAPGAEIGEDLAKRAYYARPIAREPGTWTAMLRNAARVAGSGRKETRTGWARKENSSGAACSTRTRLENHLLNPCGPWIVCADGFRLSVEAGDDTYSRSVYSSADSDGLAGPDSAWPGPWSHVEVVLPQSEPVPAALKKYLAAVRDWERGVEGMRSEPLRVFPLVPIETVADVIDKHGGFFEGEWQERRSAE